MGSIWHCSFVFNIVVSYPLTSVGGDLQCSRPAREYSGYGSGELKCVTVRMLMVLSDNIVSVAFQVIIAREQLISVSVNRVV